MTQIEEVQSELGEPDCKLTEPFIINDDGTLSPWLLNLTNQSEGDRNSILEEINARYSCIAKDLVDVNIKN